MKHKIIIFLALIIVVCSCSKSRRIESVLDDVASYIQDAPDSALNVINAIDTLDLFTNRVKAKYSLLHSMALDKNYIDTTAVNVIMPAVRYYEKHGSSDEKLKALYYLGRIQFNSNSLNEAIVTFTKAMRYIDVTCDKKYVSMLYSAIAITHRNNYNHDEALPYFKKAYEALNGDPDLENYSTTALLDLGLAYYSCGQLEPADSIYQNLLDRDSLSPKLKGIILSNQALLLLSKDLNNAPECVSLFEAALDNNRSIGTNKWAAYAYALSVVGEEEKSNTIFERLYESGDSSKVSSACYWRSFAEKLHNQYKSALSDYEQAMSYKNNTLRTALSQSTSTAQRDFFEAQSALERNYSRVQLYYLLSVILMLIIVGLGTVLFYTYRNHRLLAEKNAIAELASVSKAQIGQAEQLTNELITQLDEKNRTIIKLKAEYAKMYKDKFSYLAQLCDAYYMASGFTEPDKHVYKQVKRMISDIGSDRKGQQKLEKMINRDLDNIMLHFREDFPNYSEDDYRFVCYLFMGFDSVTLMTILQMPSSSSVYTRKSRIKRTVQESSSVYRSAYLRMMT